MRIKPASVFMCLLLAPYARFAAGKNIYGLNEYVNLAEFNLRLAAKLDTGAKTASLSAKDITRFKRNGETWVRFNLAVDTSHTSSIERPLARISKIKRRAGDYDPEEDKTYTARPVIELDVCMGNNMQTIEVNLTDRSSFEYPLLIGSEALKLFSALVDPSLTYASGKPACGIDATPAE